MLNVNLTNILVEMKKLTTSEENIMQYFWQHGTLKVSEILDLLPEPKPAVTTVSTIVRILEKKRFLGHKKEGRGYRYFPLISSEAYRDLTLNNLISNYFNNNHMQLVSLFVQRNDIDEKDIIELLDQLKESEE